VKKVAKNNFERTSIKTILRKRKAICLGYTDLFNELCKNDPNQLVDLFNGIRIFSEQNGADKNGFRVVTNLGKHAGQTVFHTHLHVLAGESLGHFGA
jgi:histidine triad (HIT) family protein